ncbi:MAG: ATP-binding cassette domain-containing protein [Gaiellaceae bacterium]
MTLQTTPDAAEQQEAPFLRLRGVHKRYGSVTALRGVDLDVSAGEVVALVGDNGAGKSTLIKTISGAVAADEGEFFVGGQEVSVSSPHAAASLGIATVYQDLALCENLDVVANLFLGSELARPPLVGVLRRLREPEMRRVARETLASLSVDLPALDLPVAGLSGGQRQAVAVARALLFGSRLVILDEPTAALGVQQTAQVLQLVRRLAGRGQAVLLVSHSLPDVFAVADRICVLRLGSNAGTFVRSETNADEIVGAMTGGFGLGAK